jgi:hypothetical protein
MPCALLLLLLSEAGRLPDEAAITMTARVAGSRPVRSAAKSQGQPPDSMAAGAQLGGCCVCVEYDVIYCELEQMSRAPNAYACFCPHQQDRLC